jgi:hypothetical protein
VFHIGPSKITPIQCNVIKALNFSKRWYLRNPPEKFKVEAWFASETDDCHRHGVPFYLSAPDKKEDKSYRTFFGPGFSHTGVMYAETNHNISKALTRLTCDPEPTEEIGENQVKLLSTPPRVIRRLRAALLQHFRQCIDAHPSDWHDELLKYAETDHPKRKLRLQAALEIIADNLFTISSERRNWTFIRRVNAKFKKMEWAKEGKFPRLIADLSVVGSLLAGYAYDRLKAYLSAFNYRNTMYVKSASHEALHSAFQKLMQPDNFQFVYFSDDSCLSFIDKHGRLRMYNMDISCCDGSHTTQLFDFIESCIPDPVLKSIIAGCHDQLKLPLTLTSSCGSRAGVLDHRDDTVYGTCLYSGSTATTFTNNMANLLIGMLVRESIKSGYDSEEDIIRAARAAGYKVTLECCDHPQQLQFLKHSPTSNGEPWLNLGVMFRTLGVSKYDIPVRAKTMQQKAEIFQSALVAGFKHAGQHPFTKLLAEKHKFRGRVHSENYLLQEHIKNPVVPVTVTLDDICKRYCIDAWQYEEICHLYRCAGFGDIVRSSGTDAIFRRDYGYVAS